MAIVREQWLKVLDTSANVATYVSDQAWTTIGGADHVLVLAITFTDLTGKLRFAETTVFAGATQMTLAAGLSWANGQQPGAGIYYLVNPPAGSTTFTANVKDASGASVDIRACVMAAFELSGIDAADVIEDADAATFGSGTPARITLTSANDNCFGIVTGGVYGGGHIPWEPFGSTELLDGQTGTLGFNDHGYFLGQWEATSAGDYTVGADPASEDSKAFAAVLFNPAPAPSAPAIFVGNDLAAMDVGATPFASKYLGNT